MGATPKPTISPAKIPMAESKDANPPWRQPAAIAARPATTIKPSTIHAGYTNSPLSVYCLTYKTLLDPPFIVSGGPDGLVQLNHRFIRPFLLPTGGDDYDR